MYSWITNPYSSEPNVMLLFDRIITIWLLKTPTRFDWISLNINNEFVFLLQNISLFWINLINFWYLSCYFLLSYAALGNIFTTWCIDVQYDGVFFSYGVISTVKPNCYFTLCVCSKGIYFSIWMNVTNVT